MEVAMPQRYFVVAPDSLGQEIPVTERLPKEFPGVLQKDAIAWAKKEYPGWILVVVVEEPIVTTFMPPPSILNRIPRPQEVNGESYSHQNK